MNCPIFYLTICSDDVLVTFGVQTVDIQETTVNIGLDTTVGSGIQSHFSTWL